MAVTTSKVTYSLKPETVERVEELALRWGVPKSEVVRRAIETVAAEKPVEEKPMTPLEAFQSIQARGGIPRVVADKWCAEVRRIRRASGRKRA